MPRPPAPAPAATSAPTARSAPKTGAAPLPRPDLRVVLLALAGWAGALAVLGLPGWCWPTALLLGGVGALRRRRRGRSVATLTGCLVAAAAVASVSAVRVEANRSSPVADLAGQGAAVTVVGTVRTDPVVRDGRFGSFTLTRLTVRRVVGRGREYATAVPVLVIGDTDWSRVRLGARVETTGRLGPAGGVDLAGVLSTGRAPRVLEQPADVLAGAERVRSALRSSVGGPADARALVPALVVGDDQRMSAEAVEDFRTCGLTHLAAVSGTNLTLVVGFLLVLARWAGVRARGLLVVGIVGVVGFVVLARPEPSVLRAAAMGSVALVGMSTRGGGVRGAVRDHGVRALGVAVLLLLLIDPWLATSVGFVLSALATAGILVLGPPFRDALATWLPRWAAEALAIPLAAQLACTPVVAAISGQVSLVAVLANLLVAPAVAPATVLGLLGAFLTLVAEPVGGLCGTLAGWSAAWIIAVAVRLADLPTAAVDWSAGVVSVAVLALLCVVVGLGAGRVLARPRAALGLGVVLVVVMLRPLPTPGWPPDGWVLVACDVGQGDGLVLNAGDGAAVVVDTGPDPPAMKRCLDRLGVRQVPVVVLTHFHADHVDGLPSVLADRRVGEVELTGEEDPASGAEQVRRWAAARDVAVRVPAYGEVRRVGALTWQVVGPVAPARARASTPGGTRSSEGGSSANNASLVLVVQVRGVRILLAGDIEPEAQQRLERSLPDLRVDVLKVPHHGSRYQDPALLRGLGARLAVVSVGRGNDYGHPASATLSLLRGAGMRVARTDELGDVAVVVRDGRLRVQGR